MKGLPWMCGKSQNGTQTVSWSPSYSRATRPSELAFKAFVDKADGTVWWDGLILDAWEPTVPPF